MALANEEGLVNKLESLGEKCIGDGTYRNPVFVNSKRGLSRPLLDVIRCAKARHETFNTRMKRATIFRQLRGFRHDEEMHGICFEAIANITEIEIEIESPLFNMSRQLNAFDSYYRRHQRRHHHQHHV